MTNERAIELLNRISDSQFDGIHGDERREALEMAVRALESNLVKGSDGLVNDLVKDCISRQQAIGALNDEYHGMISDESMKIYQIINWISALPSAHPQWIPCSERLPEKCKGNEDTEYLVTIDNGEFKYVTSEFWIYWYGNWKWNCDGVIAWMPLQKPYGGESDD